MIFSLLWLEKLNITSLTKLVHNVAALTRALELDKPDAGGMLPETATIIPFPTIKSVALL